MAAKLFSSTYKEVIGKHRITAGIKGRYKELDSFENNGQDMLFSPFTNEKIASIFFQDQYSLSEQELLTLGVSYNYITRNGGAENDPLLQLRFGYIRSSEEWSYKAYLYRTQFSLDALSRYLNPNNYNNVPQQTTVGLSQELTYKHEEHDLSLLISLFKDEDGLIVVSSPDGTSKDTKYFTSVLRYDYTFDMDNKLYTQVYYAHFNDIFGLDELEDISGYASIANSYEDFDFYNGVIWHVNSLDWHSHFDLTSSITWNYSEDFTVTLKGQNLLDKAKSTNLFRIDPTTGGMLTPLNISPIDQRITIELEYIF